MTQTPLAVRIALVQHACGPDPAHNFDRASSLIRDAAQQGARIVVTQELFASLYFPQSQNESHFELAEPIPGPTSGRLCELAKELGIELVASLFEKRAQGLYHNTLITIDTSGRIISKYRKMHIPDDPGFYEKYYFTPGDPTPGPGSPPVPGSIPTSTGATAGQGHAGDTSPAAAWRCVATQYAKIGTLICWDQWFPEAARLVCLHGAQILFYPTAIGWHRHEPPQERDRQRDAWQVVQRAHAIANGVYVVAINRVGVEGDLEFWGSSFVADPGGRIVAEASRDQPEVLVVDCDLSRIEQIRQQWPFLRDRRVDVYHGLTHRYLDS